MKSDAQIITAKEAVRDQIASTLRHIDRRIAAYTEKMNANYLHFFEWNAEEMFKEQIRRKFYSELASILEERDCENLGEWLLAIAQRKESNIARGSLTRNSTNAMANNAHLLNLQAEQEMIIELEGMAHLANCYSK